MEFFREDGYTNVTNSNLKIDDGDDTLFICGYEAGCLGFTLYHQLTARNVKFVILAPSTIAASAEQKKLKTDKWDAARISCCLAHHDYSPVHVPTEQDERVKEYLRMRDDHKLALKKDAESMDINRLLSRSQNLAQRKGKGGDK